MVDVAQLVESRIVIPAVAGSSPVVHPTHFHGPLAQLVEQLTLNQLVVGSNPTRPTISRFGGESGETGRRAGLRSLWGNP